MRNPLRFTMLFLLAGLLSSCGKQPSAPPPPESKPKTEQPVSNPEPPKKIVLPGLENGMLKIQNVPGTLPEPPEKPSVEADRRQIRIVDKAPDGTVILPGGGQTTSKRQKWDKRTPVPPRSLAARMASGSGKKGIQWAPQRVSGSVQGVRLPDAVLSPDQSVFAFVETTGKPEGPYGSRIVFLSAHDWTIPRILETDRKIEKICFVENSVLLAALCAKQPEMNQPSGLAVFQSDTGKLQEFRKLPESLSGHLMSDRTGKLYLSDREKPEIRILDSGDLKAPMGKMKVGMKNAVTALSPDGKRIAVSCGQGTIDLFKTTDHRPISTVRIPDDYPISQILFMDNGKNFVCAANPLSNAPSFLLRADQVFDLEGASAGFNGITADGKTVIHAKKVRGELELIDAVTLRKTESVFPEQIHPRTQGGDPAHVFPLEANRALAILDTRGNFYLIFRPRGESRYQKETIFMPVK